MDTNSRQNPSAAAQPSSAFVLVVAGFITSLLTANLIAVKLIEVWGWVLPAGIIIFPISYILGDVLTEVYGYPRARQVIWLGFACNLLAVYTPRLLAASFLAYLVGEFANAFVLAKLKIATRGRWLWTRTIGSTLVGQLLDSVVFITIAFASIMPPKALLTASLVQWLAKSAYEAMVTPLTYKAAHILKRRA